MKSDASRIQDLNALYEAIHKPGISISHKEYLERVMDRILRESNTTRQLRDKLIQATRVGDKYTQTYCINELLRERKKEIGNSQDYLDIKL